jgi:glycosyltransferase involved in cell wall biosynthesis
MRIGFLLPSNFAVGNPGNGIAEQARNQAAALRRLGHDVLHLSPWEHQQNLDVLHLFSGGMPFFGIEKNRQLTNPGLLAISPIIDSNQSYAMYRLAAAAGNIFNRFPTTPGVLRRQVCASDVVICRSRHERARVTRGLGVPTDKAEIVLNGIDVSPPSPDDISEVQRSLCLPSEFVLHISAYTQDRKNVLRLADAVGRIGYPLIIAGAAAPGAVLETLEKRADASGGKLRLLGFVDKKTRNALYGLCKVFCLPSLHEGTGLAALEAGTLGANVVITKNGGSRDYFSNLAEYVDPFDIGDIMHAVERAWNRPKTRELNKHLSTTLTWDQSARALEAVYRSHLNRRSQLERC